MSMPVLNALIKRNLNGVNPADCATAKSIF
jgi:hypothetical protein